MVDGMGLQLPNGQKTQRNFASTGDEQCKLKLLPAITTRLWCWKSVFCSRVVTNSSSIVPGVAVPSRDVTGVDAGWIDAAVSADTDVVLVVTFPTIHAWMLSTVHFINPNPTHCQVNLWTHTQPSGSNPNITNNA